MKVRVWLRRTTVANLALSVAALVVVCGVVEVVLRLAAPQRLAGYRYSKVLGWEPIPGHRYLEVQPEFRHAVRINSEGMRDIERQRDKPANTLRIALLGDSFAEALQVPLEHSLSRQLEQALNRAGLVCSSSISGGTPPLRFEVLNYGVSGYGTGQQVLQFREKAIRFSPDFVLLSFCYNDLSDNAQCGLVVPEGDDVRFQTESSPLWRVAFRRLRTMLRTHSHLYCLLTDNLRKVRAALAAEAVRECTDAFRTEETPEAAERWKLLRACLRSAQVDCAAHGVPLAVYLVTDQWQLDSELWKAACQTAGLRPEAYDPAGLNRKVRDQCLELGIPCVDLLPEFMQADDPQGLHFPRDGHWTEAGHRLAAGVLAAYLSARFAELPGVTLRGGGERPANPSAGFEPKP